MWDECWTCCAASTNPIGAVEMGDGFWGPWMDKNVRKAIPEFYKLMEEHGTIDNFRWQAESENVDFDYPMKGSFASESDVYKWLEGACLVLQSHQSAQFRPTAQAVTDLIAASQGDDGYLYLNTVAGAYESPKQRFTKLSGSHELYCMGHLMQAAIACYRATGQQELLEVACRCADYIGTEFGPGKREETDSHPEIEMALVELYRTTDQQRYLDMAGFFISQPQPVQDLPPIAQRPELVGHAVRSGYICCGAADYCAETGDQQLWQHLVELWEDLVTSKVYITGGGGAHHREEEFGEGLIDSLTELNVGLDIVFSFQPGKLAIRPAMTGFMARSLSGSVFVIVVSLPPSSSDLHRPAIRRRTTSTFSLAVWAAASSGQQSSSIGTLGC